MDSAKLLIIDGSEHFTELLSMRLLNCGHNNFHISSSGREGLAALDVMHPDIVVISTLLLDNDGYNICRQVKNKYGDEVKVILMSGLTEIYDAERSKSVLADEYVVKTMDCVFLLAAIKKTIFHRVYS